MHDLISRLIDHMMERWKSIFAKGLKLGRFCLQGFLSFLHLAGASPSAQVGNVQGCLECPHPSGHLSSLHLSASPSDTPASLLRALSGASLLHQGSSRHLVRLLLILAACLLAFPPLYLRGRLSLHLSFLSLSLPHGYAAHIFLTSHRTCRG